MIIYNYCFLWAIFLRVYSQATGCRETGREQVYEESANEDDDHDPVGRAGQFGAVVVYQLSEGKEVADNTDGSELCRCGSEICA